MILPVRQPPDRAGESRSGARRIAGMLRALSLWAPWVRRHPRLVAVLVALVLVGGTGLLAVPWLIGSPLGIGLARPWIESTLAARLGPGYAVAIGSTSASRDADGLTVLLLRDLSVRGPDGQTLATVPTAEVAVERDGILGTPQPRRIDVVGAEMLVRIADGRVIVSARPEGAARPPAPAAPRAPTTAADMAHPPLLASLVAVLDGIERDGFGGLGLSSIGLKRGTLAVDHAATGQQWRFEDITLAVNRPTEGGVTVTVSSGGTDGPWSITATVSPGGGDERAVDVVARELAPRDLLLALGLHDTNLHADAAVNAIVRARIGRDGALMSAEARINAGAGSIGPLDDPEARLVIDDASVDLRWDGQRRVIIADPVQVQAGFSRYLLSLGIAPPVPNESAWTWRVLRGRFDLGSERTREVPLVLDRISASGRVNPTAGMFAIDRMEIGGSTIAVVGSGQIGTVNGERVVQLGVTGGRMPVHVAKRLWPAIVAPPLRAWMLRRVVGGTLERADIALNTPLETLLRKELPLPDGGLKADFVVSAGVLRPVDGLPLLREIEARAEVTGRTARVTLPRAVAEAPGGRRLDLADGVVDVPDTFPKDAPARIRFRVDGGADALADVLSTELLRGQSGLTLDPATTRGTVSGTVQLGLPLVRDVPRSAVIHAVEATLTNFAADKQIRGQRLEAATVRITATSGQGLSMRGEGKVVGAPITFEMRRLRPDIDAEVRFQTTLDDAARGKLGLDGPSLNGPIALKGQGRIGDRETRLALEVDLKDATIQELIPGWVKARGRPARAVFTVTERAGTVRLDDLVLEGSGAQVRGTIDLDADGEPVSVNLPTFQLSDGDKASLRIERGNDASLRMTLRGEVFDVRTLLKSSLSGPAGTPANKPRPRPRDMDLDVKLGVVTGHNGEAARQVDLRLSRRGGEMRAFGLVARVGEGAVSGDLRVREGARTAIFLTATDAGALIRFVDLYSKISGGDLWMLIDPPAPDGVAPQEGILNIRSFTIRDPALDRLIAAAPADRDRGEGARASGRSSPGQAVAFSRMQVQFTRAPAKLSLREGVIWGPLVGATIEGQIDYARNEALLRGTYVPAYGLNNLFARIPIVGLFMGGPNEGLLGVTYEVSGPPSAPTLRINPMSAVAPGFLRKLFEFRGTPEGPPPDLADR